MGMFSDFLNRLRGKPKVKVSLSKEDALIIQKAQEIVNEYSKSAKIDPPEVVAKSDSYFYDNLSGKINISLAHAKAYPDEVGTILAHEIGHAQGGESGKERKKAANQFAVTNAYRFIPGALGVAALFSSDPKAIVMFAFGQAVSMAWNANFFGYSKAEMDEESRADRFAIEKLGMDPLFSKAIREALENHNWDGSPKKERGFLSPPSRGHSSYLLKVCAERIAEGAPEPKIQPRIPSRFSRPPVLQEPEVTSTGRLVKPNARGPDRDYDAPEPVPEKKRGLVLQMKRDR